MAAQSLTHAQHVRLLRIAREAIYHHVSRGRRPPVTESDPALLQPLGCFVSLHVGDRLRGCIGTFDDATPLVENVSRMAVSAASEDPRFAPLRMDEVPKIDIELTVLGPLVPARAEEVEVGRHGVLISRKRARGTLLPQVAVQHGWTREEFLAQTCQKAGLDSEDWRLPDTSIQVFEADVFSESALREAR